MNIWFVGLIVLTGALIAASWVSTSAARRNARRDNKFGWDQGLAFGGPVALAAWHLWGKGLPPEPDHKPTFLQQETPLWLVVSLLTTLLFFLAVIWWAFFRSARW